MGSDIAAEIRKRAGDVCQDGQYCGLFELTVWAALKEIRVLCSFGAEIIDVHFFCIKNVPRIKPRNTIRVAAMYCTPDEMWSADNPDLFAPQANHFVAAHGQTKYSGLNKTNPDIRKFGRASCV